MSHAVRVQIPARDPATILATCRKLGMEDPTVVPGGTQVLLHNGVALVFGSDGAVKTSPEQLQFIAANKKATDSVPMAILPKSVVFSKTSNKKESRET